jgi:hypothetical protein
MSDEPKKKKREVIYVDSLGVCDDLNADWLKHLDGGRYQEQDLAAHDAVYPLKDREEDDEDEEEEDDDE